MITKSRSTTQAILIPVLAFVVAVCGCQRQEWEIFVDTSTTTPQAELLADDALTATERETSATAAKERAAVNLQALTEDSTEAADVLRGNVVRVIDGDTLEILVDDKPVRIRLERIDTPEKGQPFGDKAKRALSDLVFGQAVRVQSIGEDRYGRTLGRVFVSRDVGEEQTELIDVNHRLVNEGFAWWYEQYSDDEKSSRCPKGGQRGQAGVVGGPVAYCPLGTGGRESEILTRNERRATTERCRFTEAVQHPGEIPPGMPREVASSPA